MSARVDYLAALGLTDWQQRRPLALAGAPVAPPPVQPAIIPDAPGARVREAAPVRGPDSWDAVAAEVAGCTRCELHTCRNRTVKRRARRRIARANPSWVAPASC
jgi:hypothetical protein